MKAVLIDSEIEAEFREVLRKMRAEPVRIKELTPVEREKLWKEFMADPKRSDILRQFGFDDV